MPAADTEKVARLVRRLSEEAFDFDVEARGGVAILTPRGEGGTTLDATARRRLVQLAREVGFPNVALEV